MNERIKNLSKKAWLLAHEANDQAEEDEGEELTEAEFGNVFQQKFAELIVRECAQVSEDDITDGDACCTNTADRIARQIKKHFGVEE